MTEQVLKGSEAHKRDGNFVLTGQKTATDQHFKNVSKIWYDQTMSYEQGLAQIEIGRAATEEINATVQEMVPSVNSKGQFVMRYQDGREFVPTVHAVMQMGNWAGTGTWYVESLLANPVDMKGRELYRRDKGDSEALAFALRNGFRHVKNGQGKKFLWRTRKDGTLRAMLTDRYAIIDNRWFIEKLQSFMPGGRLSHWRGDSDTVWGNILIPDTIRQEKDSDYGGMLSVGNSEIGERRVSSLPSIFRAICMNGCIWGQELGKAIKQVHRGKVNLTSLALEIQTNLNSQIPLLPQGIDILLKTRAIGWDGAEAKTVIAQVAKDSKFSKKQAGAVLNAYVEEVNLVPDYAKSLFGLINGITRASQKQVNADWVKFDVLAGKYAQMDKDSFDHLVVKAKRLKVKEVEEVYA